MKIILSVFWYIFLLGGYFIALLMNMGQLPSWVLYIIIVIGLIFYIAKLRYINNCSLFELNLYTLVFDILYYLYFVLLISIMWLILYKLIKYCLLEPYYSIVFPKPDSFYLFARQWLFVGSFYGISSAINAGVNYAIKLFNFTDKVAVIEIIRVLIILLWVCIFPTYIFAFISILSFNTMPEHVKRWISSWLTWWYKIDIDLVNRIVQNNLPTAYLKPGQLRIFIWDLLTIPITVDMRYFIAPLSVVMLSAFIIGEIFIPTKVI